MNGAALTIHSDWETPKVIIDSRSQPGLGASTMPSVASVRPRLARSRARLRPIWSTSTPAGRALSSAIRLGSDWSSPKKLREYPWLTTYRLKMSI